MPKRRVCAVTASSRASGSPFILPAARTRLAEFCSIAAAVQRAGNPSAAFTVYAATPQRDSAVIGFLASTAVADATHVYLRYNGTVGSGTDNHMLKVGVRFSW